MTALELLRPHTTHSAQQRGWEYVDLVEILEADARSVSADVTGTDVYEVSIRVAGQSLRVFCGCPYFGDRGSACKHLWATAVVANERGWLTDLPAGLRVVMDFDDLEDHELLVPERGRVEQPYPRSVTPPRPASPPDWAIALAAATRSSATRPAAAWAGSQLLYVLTAPVRATLTELPLVVEQREKKRRKLSRTSASESIEEWSKAQPARLTPADIEELPDPDDRWALSLAHATSTYPHYSSGYGYGLHADALGVVYLKAALLDLLLPRLCGTGRVRLRQPQSNAVPGVKREEEAPLTWDAGEPWRFRLVITRDVLPSPAGTEVPGGDGGAGYRVDAVLTRDERRESIERFALLTDSLAVLDNVAAPFDPAGGLTWAVQLRARKPVVVPEASRRTLLESIARSGVEHVELPADLKWEERVVTPRFRATIGQPNLYLAACPIDFAVEYEDTRAPMDAGERLMSEDGRVLYRRDQAAELDALATLKQHGVAGLEILSAGLMPRPYARQQGPTINAKKLPALVQALVEQGWRVDADGVRYRAIAAPHLHISSNIDWFELNAEDELGAAVDLPELVKALNAGRRSVTLGDGTIGMLPEAWLARVAPLLSLGESSESGVRFKPSQVALIDALLAAQPAVDWDEGFARARDAMQRFEGVHAKDAPPTLQGVLREYQREALGWMHFLRDFGFGGCLADDMGLGKTVMVLAMLEARRLDATRAHRPSLIVLPRSLLFNWMSEATRFAPGLRLLDFAHADRHGAVDAIAEADLVLTTYGTLRRDVAALQKIQFDYVVLDEAQAIKNANTATAKATRLLRGDHRLALTGTPVENHLGELHSLFDFLNPGLLGRGKVLDLRQSGADDPHAHIARLAKGLRPFFLRRTKEQVAPELPQRTEETLFCELDGEQRATYLELRDHYRRVLLEKIDRDGLAKSKFQILEALLRLRQAACHTGLLPGRGGTVAREDRAAGGHSLRSGGDTVDRHQASAKFDLLLPRLTELVAEGRKALVFSQFTSLLALLRQQLHAEGVTYEYLDGRTRDRAERVARFQEDASCPLFLISLKAGGVGLNLTAAEYVFLLDPWWNPAVEMQAIDRTHRIGQTKPVFAYRLVARETVEERILELQSRKRALADAILEAGTGGLRGLKREDLEQLLS